MTDEYTPSTGDVKTAWIAHHIDGTDESPMPMSKWEAQFDRWLSSVKAEAWDEGADVGYYTGYRDRGDSGYYDSTKLVNPYRQGVQ